MLFVGKLGHVNYQKGKKVVITSTVRLATTSEELVQAVKCLSCKHSYFNSDPKHPSKNLGVVGCLGSKFK